MHEEPPQLTYDRPLPHDDELEQALIAGLVQTCTPDQARIILEDLPEKLWANPAHMSLVNLILDLIDAKIMSPSLFVRQSPQEAGGRTYAANVLAVEVDIEPEDLEKYVRRLKALAHRREIIRQSTATIQDAWLTETSPEDIDAGRILHVRTNMSYYVPEDLNPTAASDSFDKLRERIANPAEPMMTTGIAEIDVKTVIIPEYYLIMARTTCGKTALQLALIFNMLITRKNVLLFSMEQSAAQIIGKLVSIYSGCSGRKVLGAWKASEEESKEIENGRQWIREREEAGNLKIVAEPRTVESLAALAMKHQDREGLSAVFIDTFDKFRVDAKTSREQALSTCSNGVFRLQRQLDVPVFMNAQLGEAARNDSLEPQPWHLTYCRQALKDADRQWVIENPQCEPDRFAKLEKKRQRLAMKGDYADAADADWGGRAEIRQTKDRNGTGGGHWREQVGFDRGCGSFHTLHPADDKQF